MLTFPKPSVPCGRYAPSPTGLLHVGSARTALVAWLSARSRDGRFILRVEDLDGPRVVPGMAEAILDDLRWLGLDWDQGPDCGGPHRPYRQSERHALYEAALYRLHVAGRLFPCRYSRKDLRDLASAPHGPGAAPAYPRALRPQHLGASWFEELRAAAQPDAALRFCVRDEPVVFHDRICGRVTEHVADTTGDFVLKRRDGLYAYQLAVVVDDLLMGVDEVVRGQDLLASTARQLQLIDALGGTRPAYAHVPLVVNAAGEKLSKRDEALTLRALRAHEVPPEALVGYLGYSLGFRSRPTPCAAVDLLPGFAWSRLSRAPWALPDDLPERLRTPA